MARVLLAGLLVVWAVQLVGAQRGFVSRWRMDLAESTELRRLVPDPAPYTFFVPLGIGARALETGSPVLDGHFRSVWEFPWTTPNWIMRLYRRDDVRCGYWRHWTPGVPVLGADGRGIHYADTLGPRFPEIGEGVRLIPWERAVVFGVGLDRKLRVATKVVLEGAGGGEEEEVVVPQAAGRGLEEFVVRMRRR